MSSQFTVFYNAYELPAPLRDVLMRLALAELYRARWTDMIHDEWIRNVLKQRPKLKPEDLNYTRSLMNTHVNDRLLELRNVLTDRYSGSFMKDQLNSVFSQPTQEGLGI